MKKALLYVFTAGLIVFVLIQLVPFGHNHTNPPVVQEPNWDSPATRQMAKDYCFQCHSNETQWPWYSNIAPASWLVYNDVAEGRREFNFSDWGNNPGEPDEMVEQIQSGGMPPIQYWIFHPSSRLNAAQKEAFINGLQATIGGMAKLP
jgi:mono/diheme cytochrome c family protein